MHQYISRSVLAILLVALAMAGSANASVAFSDIWNTIEYAEGSGDDQALLIIDFGNTSPVGSYAFGFEFSAGTVTGEDMIRGVGTEWDGMSALDPNELYFDGSTGGFGFFVNNFYYQGETTQPSSFWQYYIAESDMAGNFPGWTESPTGSTGRTLVDLSWDGWYNPGFVGEGTPSVPIPGAAWLLGSGLVALVGLRRRAGRL